MGGGPAISCGPHVHPKVFAKLKEVAEERGYTRSSRRRGLGHRRLRDAGHPIGVATGLISVPLRYMHTSVETLAIDDVKKNQGSSWPTSWRLSMPSSGGIDMLLGLLEKLSNARGIPGQEAEVRELIKSEISSFVDDMVVGPISNLIAVHKGRRATPK